jgi:hypothetical protein
VQVEPLERGNDSCWEPLPHEDETAVALLLDPAGGDPLAQNRLEHDGLPSRRRTRSGRRPRRRGLFEGQTRRDSNRHAVQFPSGEAALSSRASAPFQTETLPRLRRAFAG